MNASETSSVWDDALVLWEWRTFAPLRAGDLRKIETLPRKAVERFIDEYIVLPGRGDLNIKIRPQSFKVKRLLRETDAGQAWAHVEVPLPTTGRTVVQLLGDQVVTDGEVSSSVESDELRWLLSPCRVPGVAFVRLDKTRQLFLLDVGGRRVRVELATLHLERERRVTLAIDAWSRAELHQARQLLGLERYPASDYLQWLRGGQEAP